MRVFFFFKQKTAYEMRISDWSSDVCSSDLSATGTANAASASCAPTEGAGYDRWNAERTGGYAGPATARGEPANHAIVAQDADRSWRCVQPRHRGRADLCASDPQCRSGRQGVVFDRKPHHGRRIDRAAARLHRRPETRTDRKSKRLKPSN